MTKTEFKRNPPNVKAVFSEEKDGLRAIFGEVIRGVREQEMSDPLGAGKGERSAARPGYRSGYYERYQRSGKALVSALAEMNVQGVSTRQVNRVRNAKKNTYALESKENNPKAAAYPKKAY